MARRTRECCSAPVSRAASPALRGNRVDGSDDPNTSAVFPGAVQALFSLSYTLRFALKKSDGLEYRLWPLEALWWADDMARFRVGRKAD